MMPAALRRDDERALWLAESAAAADAALASDALGVRPAGMRVPPHLHGSAAGDLFGRLVRTADGREHAALKRALSEALVAVDLRELRVRCERLSALTIRDLHGEAALAALVYGLAAPIASLLGLDDADAVRVAARTNDLVRALLPGADPGTVAHGSTVASELRATFVAHDDANAGPTLFTTFGRLARNARIDEETTLANAIGLLWQGTDAMAALAGAAFVALASAPADERERLRFDRDACDAFLRDLVRANAPVANTRRFAACDARVSDAAVRAGDEIVVSLDGAHAFGAHAHACPGREIAFVACSAAVRTVLEHGLDAFVPADVRYLARANARIISLGGRTS